MLMKPRAESRELFELEAAERRIHQQHPHYERILMDLKRKKRQLRGEREVEFPLSFLDEKKYLIMHDLRLKDEQGYFQIDSLLLCNAFALILEVKNWYGTIHFSENGQVIRIGDDDKEEGFPNPIPQAKLQQYRLRKLLNNLGIKDLPIEYLIVISFPSTIIKSIPPAVIPDKVIHNRQLLFQIQELDKSYKSGPLTIRKLTNIAKNIIEMHQNSEKNIMKIYQINSKDLIKGVICPECSHVPMIREFQKWLCIKCNHKSINAHIQALSDYKYLIDSNVTNKRARDFLLINSPDVVRRLLKQGGYEKIGNNKGSVYKL